MTSSRFGNLWSRGDRRAVVGRGQRRRKAVAGLSSGESLEPRSMLAVSAVYYDDFQSTNPAGSSGAAWTNSNTEKGVLVLTLDGTGGSGDDVFMRVVNGNYVFATDANFTNPLSISTYGYAAPSDGPVNPPGTGGAVNPVPGSPGSFSGTIGTSIPSTFAHSYTLQVTDPTVVAGSPPTITPGTSGVFTSQFDTILVRTSGLADGVDTPTFTIVGGSQNVTKTLIVDLTDDSGNPISGSAITVGAPVAVAATTADGVIGSFFGTIAADASPSTGVTTPSRQAGTVYLQSESITLNAAVTSQNSLSLLSGIGASSTSGSVAGIVVNAAVIAPGSVSVDALGTGFSVNAGGSISNGFNAATKVFAPSASLTLQLQDANAEIAGNVAATQQSYFVQASAGAPADSTERVITTRSTSTGIQSGLISGDQLVVYLASKAGPAAARDGTFDIQSNVNTVRITSAATTVADALDYDITLANKQSLTLDTVMASKGDISFSAITGNADTIRLLAAIDTLGSFSLASGGDLTVDSSITSAANVSLSSTSKSVTTAAAITTREASTKLGQVTIVAKTDVTIGSLVKAEHDGIAITAGGKILSDTNVASEVTSRISGTSATLTAVTGIDLGTNIGSLDAKVTGVGAITISDNRDDGTQLSATSVTTVDGSITLESVQNIDLVKVIAGGTGDIAVTSSAGNIDLASVVADNNAVSLTAAEFDTDLAGWLAGTATVLHAGFITGIAPTATEIAWTGANVVTDAADPTTSNINLYRNIPTISAHRLVTGDIEFTADGGVTLKSVVTADGSVTVTSTYGDITAQSAVARQGDTVAAANVTLSANGDVRLGSVVAEVGFVDVTAGQGIADDGDAATTGIVSDAVTLRAAANGVSSDIGSAAANGRVNVASPTIGGTVSLIVERASADGAVDAGSVFIGSTSAVALTAAAVSLVDVQATGAISDVNVLSAVVSDTAGQIVVESGRNLTVGTAEVAEGVFDTLSKISLTASNGSILNADPADPAQTSLLSYALSLKARTFDGTFDAASLDAISRFSATATATGGTAIFAFDRDTDLTLDGVVTKSGNIRIANNGTGDLLIGATGITAGGTGAVNLSASGGGIGKPVDPAELPGTIAGSTVTLSASDDITALTKASQLAAASTAGVIDIQQTGDVKLGDIKTTAAGATVTLSVTGSILPGAGTVTTGTAVISATTGMSLKTDVDTLSATAASGNLTVTEANGLSVGQNGIQAPGGTATIILTKGTLNGGGQPISGKAVVIQLLEANNSINVQTSASSIAASTALGDITIINDKSFSVGSAGVVAGNGVSNVSLQSTNGKITGGTGTGTIKATELTLSAATGIVTNTNVATITSATTATGDISLTQSGQGVALASIVSSNGSVTVSNDDDIVVTKVRALGAGRNVTITASGVNKSIAISPDSIVAEGDKATLSATGGIDGKSAGTEPDITAGQVFLGASSGDVTATLKTDRVEASAQGTDPVTGKASNLDITLLGTRPVFLDPSTGSTLSASGDVSLTALNSDDPTVGVDIIVVENPSSDAGNVALNTLGQVTFAVTQTQFDGPGTLTQALLDASTVNNNLDGTVGVAFATTIARPIALTDTIPLDATVTLDGTRRINTTTGTYAMGRPIDIDGSALAANSSGFQLLAKADNSIIRGFAFYGFSKTGGVAVEVAGDDDDAVENASITGNLFGISATGRVSANKVGISATNATKLTIGGTTPGTGNTVVKSTDAGIRLGEGVEAAVVTGNFIGTNATRTNLGNAVGIVVSGAGAGNVIGGSAAGTRNLVAFNGTGISVIDTDATGGDATDIRGNEVLLNGTGILVNGDAGSHNVVVAANTVTRNTLDGIKVNGASSDVRIGSASSAAAADMTDRNYVGTTASNSLGLGNARNGIVVSSSGTGIEVRNNIVLGNGTANAAGDNNGIKLSGSDAGTVVARNTLNANRGAGLFATASAGGKLTGNAITSNYASGVLVSDGANITVGSLASETDDATIRANANTINSNLRYGVEVLGESGARAAAFAQIVGNSMASNRLGGIANAALTAPVITSTTFSRANGTLTVRFSNLVSGQVVNVYAGTAQGRTYLGRFVATGTTGTFTMTRAQQVTAGVSAQVFAGAVITGTRSSTGANGQTSPLARGVSATRT